MEATVRGNLGADPELRHVGQDQTPVVRLRVAVRQTAQERERGNPTVWINVTAFGALAERMASTFKSGTPVLLQGLWKRDEWTDPESGERRHDTYVTALAGGPDLSSCTVAGVQRPEREGQSPAAPATEPATPAPAPDPFDE